MSTLASARRLPGVSGACSGVVPALAFAVKPLVALLGRLVGAAALRRHPDPLPALFARGALRSRCVGAVGRSLGSGVAAQLAGARPVDRLALLTPFDSLSGVAALHYPWLPVRLLMKDDYDSAAALADFRGPVFILEAGRDTVVPGASTQRLVEALPRAPTRLRVPGADHDSALATPVEVQALKQFASVSLAEAD